MSTTQSLEELRTRLGEVSDVYGAMSLLRWDQRTTMPPGGMDIRASRLATLSRISHEMFTDERFGELLADLEPLEAELPFESDDAALVRIMRRDFEKAKIIPSDLAARASRAGSAGYQAWVEARSTSDFSKLRPALEEIIALRREEIDLVRAARPEFTDDYDVLLDDYEPGLTAVEVERVFDRLKAAAIPLVQRVRERQDRVDDAPVRGAFPVDTQRTLVTTIAKRLGFSDETWRLDPTHHPFATSIGVNDIRITTRYYEDFLNPALFGTMHEFGHGLYEHGVSRTLERTPLQRGASMAFHESQSRMWENLIGRGRPFWTYALPVLRKALPDQFKGVSEDDMYRAVNRFGPSLIRVEADELTYNLHIILRFELERDIFAGRVDVNDLPEAWNAKMREYLGIDVSDDAHGVLQDVHWGSGLFGYFPTYALGNVVALQLWQRITRELPDLDADVAAGEFGELRAWLAQNVHQHGRKFTPGELLERTVGTPSFDPEPLVAYLAAKVDALYGS